MPVCDADFDFDLDLTFTSTPAFDPRLRPSTLDHRLRPRHQPYILFTCQRPSTHRDIQGMLPVSPSPSLLFLHTYLPPTPTFPFPSFPPRHHLQFISDTSHLFPAISLPLIIYVALFTLIIVLSIFLIPTLTLPPDPALLFFNSNPPTPHNPTPRVNLVSPSLFFFTPRPSGRGNYASATR
ncbi:hypothetical protein DFH06DRAFT_1259498 [Mycena polygramma]|nr:hypothetical protein DFH06DRAFT_1259498 [Mycena polygramma]